MGIFTQETAVIFGKSNVQKPMTVGFLSGQSNIKINKMDSMLKKPECPFVLFVGTKKLVMRREFEQIISDKLMI